MGYHANYALIIQDLVMLKDEMSKLSNPKYKPLINILKEYNADPRGDNEHLPFRKDLEEKLRIPHGKINDLLKSMIFDVVRAMEFTTLKIKDVVHYLHFHIPFDEQWEMNKELRDRAWQEASFVAMKLEVTPGLGEEIEVPLINHTGKNYRGYVHNISHRIVGTTQEIYIEVHPFKDFYWKWARMKDDYEYRTSARYRRM